MKYLVITLLLLAVPVIAGEPPPATCEDVRDQWRVRFQLAQNAVNDRESMIALQVVEITKLQQKLEALEKQNGAAKDKK